MKLIALLIVENHSIQAKTPYSAGFVTDLKDEIPYFAREWQPEGKIWQVEPQYLDTLRRICERWFDEVVIDDQTTPKPQPRAATDWATALFSAAPGRLHRKLYLALAKVLHPDTGGDSAAMKTLHRLFEAAGPMTYSGCGGTLAQGETTTHPGCGA